MKDMLINKEVFTHMLSLDLNVGYYCIELSPVTKHLCTILIPWGSMSAKNYL